MNTLTETTDLVHRHSVVSEKFSNFLRTSAGNSVRYEAVNAMLLNEFLKEHKAFLEEQRRVQKQEATISQLKSTVAEQNATIAQQQKGMEAVTARLNEQAAQIQSVSAQLEASKPAPQVVDNP